MSAKNGMKYFGLSDKGIIINMYQIKKKDFYSYRISARRVMKSDDFVGLFYAKDYSDLKDEVNQLLKNKSEHLPKLNHCNLRRFDFCINAGLDNREQVKAYIKTAKRSNAPPKLEIYKEYDEKSKRRCISGQQPYKYYLCKIFGKGEICTIKEAL